MKEAKSGGEARRRWSAFAVTTALALGGASCSGTQPNATPGTEQPPGTEATPVERQAGETFQNMSRRIVAMASQGGYYKDSGGKTVEQTVTYSAGPDGKSVSIERTVQSRDPLTLGKYTVNLDYDQRLNDAKGLTISEESLPDATPTIRENNMSFYKLDVNNYRVVYKPDGQTVTFLDTDAISPPSEPMTPDNLAHAERQGADVLGSMENSQSFPVG